MFLWGLYYLQGTLYATGSIVSQGILAILLCSSLFYCYKVNVTYKLPTFFKALNAFLIMATIYGVILMLSPTQIYLFNILSNPISKMTFLKSIYISLLPIYVFYYFGKTNKLNGDIIRLFTIFWLVVVIFSFVRHFRTIETLMLDNGYTEDVEITNNIAYEFLALFPLLFFWNRRPLVQYALIFVLIAFIFSGMKRGAIFIGVICFIWFLFRVFKSSKGKKRIGIVLMSIIILSVSINYVINMYETSLYFQLRIEQTLDGNSSGRDTIFSTLWNHYKEELSLMKFLFGNGAYYTVAVAGIFAHNDWLELLINQGLLGASIYASMYLSLIYTLFRIKKNEFVFSILMMVVIIMFASSLFSMLYGSLGLPLSVALGYCLVQENKKSNMTAYNNNITQ